MAKFIVKSFSSPDEHRAFTDKGYLDIVRVGEGGVGRAVFEPGWRWSTHVKPISGTPSCEADHRGYVLAGRMHIVTDSGEEGDVGPGDYFELDPGHDAWVVGDEPCVIFDFAGFQDYAKAKTAQPAQEPVPMI